MLSQPRRLWIFTNEFEPHIIGGLGIAATHLSHAYARSGMKITVISANSPIVSKSTHAQLLIVRFPKMNTYYSAQTSQYKASQLARWLAKQRFPLPDGINIHSLQFFELAKYYQRKYRIPVVYTCHSLVASEAVPFAMKRQAMEQQAQLLRMADSVVVPSRAEYTKLKKRYPFCSYKTTVIPHGIVLRKGTSHGNRRHLLYVGRLVPLKGIEPLLHAVALLKQHEKNIRLDIVGTGPYRYRRKLKNLAHKLNITQQVHWLGHHNQRQVQNIYATHGALIVPSMQESFGLVALEALASGIPLVSTRVGGLAEFVNDSVAQTIPKAQGKAIAQAVLNMWQHKTITDRRVAQGRKLAAQFQWPRAASQYKKLFARFK